MTSTARGRTSIVQGSGEPGSTDAAGVAVELDGDGGGGLDRHPADPPVGDPGAVQVQPPDDQPEVMQGPERPGVAEDDQVEPAVVAPGRAGRTGAPARTSAG